MFEVIRVGVIAKLVAMSFCVHYVHLVETPPTFLILYIWNKAEDIMDVSFLGVLFLYQ